MDTKHKGGEIFYGTTTLGEKGQVVIPVEAREAMDLKKGEKLLVFGMGHEMLALSKLARLEKFASHMAERLNAIRKIIKKTTSK
jgi:AbrB family looped-hinge helix DNA binding protein